MRHEPKDAQSTRRGTCKHCGKSVERVSELLAWFDPDDVPPQAYECTGTAA